MATIVIDPGHGGKERIDGSDANHAVGPNGGLEKTFALRVAIAAKAKLESAGHAVFLTRDQDVNLGLVDRAALAKRVHAQVFVSVHFNSPNGTPAQGTETWVHIARTDGSDRLASCIQNRVLHRTGYRDRGVRMKPLGVLNRRNHDPGTAAALVEISFLTDQPDEENRLNDQAYITDLGTMISLATEDFLSSQDQWGEKKYDPQPVASFTSQSTEGVELGIFDTDS